MKDRTITALVAISGFVMTLAVSSWRDELWGFGPASGERQQTTGMAARIPRLTDTLTTIPFAGPARTASAVQAPEPTPQQIHTAQIRSRETRPQDVPAAAMDELPLTTPNVNDTLPEPFSAEEQELQRESRRR